MKRIKTIVIFPLLLIFMHCEDCQYVEAGIIWMDDIHFEKDGDWFLAVAEGCYEQCDGAIIDVLDQHHVVTNQNTIKRFVLSSTSGCNVTAFVYLDVNQNEQYDDGYDVLTGYKYNYCSMNETTPISIAAYF